MVLPYPRISIHFLEVKNHGKTKKSQILEPWSTYILEHIPVYPNFASLFYLVDRMQEHPCFSAMYTATSHGLAQPLRPGETAESDAPRDGRICAP